MIIKGDKAKSTIAKDLLKLYMICITYISLCTLQLNIVYDLSHKLLYMNFKNKRPKKFFSLDEPTLV